MWLLDTTTLELKHEYRPDELKYAILSHTWEHEEITFQEIQARTAEVEGKQGFKKVANCCNQALKDGYKYAWVDTCCIDKSSSAELSEAINSMFAWYQKLSVCYVYLSDVEYTESTLTTLGSHGFHDRFDSQFKHSRWFSRSWTLQELLAPMSVTFFSTDWRRLGTKLEFVDKISEFTGIARSALLGRALQDFNIAQRMSWARSRQATREEDIAYSMLGMFDIHMPLLYGEGSNAYRRLQEHILEKFEDYTIFAWEHGHDNASRTQLGLLAPSPAVFREPDGYLPAWTYSVLEPIGGLGTNHLVSSARFPMTVTSRGIHMQVLVVNRGESSMLRSAILLCEILRKADRYSSKRSWLVLQIDRLSDTAAVVGRGAQALRVMDNDNVDMFKVEQLYALRQNAWKPMNDQPSMRKTLLRGVAIDVLANFPPVDSVLLSREKIYTTCQFGCGSCYQGSIQSPERIPPPPGNVFTKQKASYSSNVSHDNHSEGVDVSAGTGDWTDVAASQKDTSLRNKHDIDIHKLEATLAKLFEDLSPLFLRLLSCCLLSLIHERHSEEPFTLVVKLVYVINFCISNCHTISAFIAKFLDTVCDRWFRYKTDALYVAASRPLLELLTRIIACCEALATDPRDKLGIKFLKASLRSFLSRESLSRFSVLQLQNTPKFNEILATYPTQTDIMQQLRALHGHEPPSSQPRDLVQWAVNAASKWSQYVPAQELRPLFQHLRLMWAYDNHQGLILLSRDRVDWYNAKLLCHCVAQRVNPSSELNEDFVHDLEVHGTEWRVVAEAMLLYNSNDFPT